MRAMEGDATGEGGDPACWAEQVCDACGQMVDATPHRCPRPLSAHDVEAFARDGYLVVPALVGPDDLATLRRACDEVLAAGDAAGVPPHEAHPTFADNAALSAGIDIARQLFGTDTVTRVHDQIVDEPSFAPAGAPIADKAAVFWVALDDVDDALPAGGCTIRAAGTPHATPQKPSPGRDRRAYVFTVVAS